MQYLHVLLQVIGSEINNVKIVELILFSFLIHFQCYCALILAAWILQPTKNWSRMLLLSLTSWIYKCGVFTILHENFLQNNLAFDSFLIGWKWMLCSIMHSFPLWILQMGQEDTDKFVRGVKELFFIVILQNTRLPSPKKGREGLLFRGQGLFVL